MFIHRNKRIVERYQTTSNRVTIEWFLFGVLGLAILGGSILAFFRSLAFDIDRVRDRAVAIVSGYRAQPLEHQRSDEVGALMDAINKMQQALRQREAEIEVARMQHFHKEKMAAVGSLAAAIAHEINNPMSAIVGVAQAMEEQCGTHGCQQFRDNCHPDMILDQAKRVMQITHRVANSPYPSPLIRNCWISMAFCETHAISLHSIVASASSNSPPTWTAICPPLWERRIISCKWQ